LIFASHTLPAVATKNSYNDPFTVYSATAFSTMSSELDVSLAVERNLQLIPSDFATYLPPSAGLLPYWYLFTAAAGIYNSAQNMAVTWQTKEIYSKRADEGMSSY
jgi:hypothetical protein